MKYWVRWPLCARAPSRVVALHNRVQGAPARGQLIDDSRAGVVSSCFAPRVLCRGCFRPSKRIRLFLHDMQVALGDLDIFMPKQFLDFLQLKLS